MALLTNKLKTRYKDWIENMCKSNHCPKKTFERPGKSGKILHKATLNIASKSGSLKVKKKKKEGWLQMFAQHCHIFGSIFDWAVSLES